MDSFHVQVQDVRCELRFRDLIADPGESLSGFGDLANGRPRLSVCGIDGFKVLF
jgi:hypothetical protein